MSSLRDIVRRHIESETRNELSELDSQQKDQVIEMLRRNGEIDRKVDSILKAFLDEFFEPQRKKRIRIRSIYSAINIALTAGIGIAVNDKS